MKHRKARLNRYQKDKKSLVKDREAGWWPGWRRCEQLLEKGKDRWFPSVMVFKKWCIGMNIWIHHDASSSLDEIYFQDLKISHCLVYLHHFVCLMPFWWEKGSCVCRRFFSTHSHPKPQAVTLLETSFLIQILR